MEICHKNSNSRLSSSSSSASVDSSNNRLMMGRQTRNSPLSSTNAFLSPAFSACIHPQNALELDPALLRYSRSSTDGFLSPVMDPSKLIRRRHHMLSLSSSRGSSPSPLSPIENLPTPPPRSPPLFKASTPPSKVVEGEEVLVMDGILVNSSSLTSMNRAASARSSADSSGSSGNSSLYKTEICRSWEDSGTCRYGTKCQFAHGKEELRPARHPKNKPEACKTFATTGAASTFGAKGRCVQQATAGQGSGAALTAFRTEAEEMVGQALQVGPEAAEAYAHKLLYGPSRTPRLPVFVEMCTEEEANSQQRYPFLPDSFSIII